MSQIQRYECFGVVPVNQKEGPKGRWNKIGAGFVNKDKSINVKLDFIPTNPDTTIQLRPVMADDPA